MTALNRENEVRRRDYVMADLMSADSGWSDRSFKVERGDHPAILMLGYDKDSVVVTFERIPDRQAERLMNEASVAQKQADCPHPTEERWFEQGSMTGGCKLCGKRWAE